MKFAFVLLICLIAFAGSDRLLAQGDRTPTAERQVNRPTSPRSDPFSPLRVLVGNWRGEGDGQPGRSRVERSYAFVMNGRFLHSRNSSIYAPQEKNRKGERHEDWGIYSVDTGRKKLVLRQFHVEGFVNQYVLDRV